MNLKSLLSVALGGISLVFGFIMTFVFIIGMFTQEFMFSFIALLFLGLAPSGFGAYMLRLGLKAMKEDKLGSSETVILRAARDHKGRLTVADVALATGMSMKDAQAALEQMQLDGHAEIEILDNGTFRYVFPSVVPGGSQMSGM